MIRLDDGTIVNLTEDGQAFLKDVVLPNTRKKTSGSQILIHGYVSKSTGTTANIGIRLKYDLDKTIKQAIQTIRDKTPKQCVKNLDVKHKVTLEVAQIAKTELMASLSESLVGTHSADTSSRSAKKFIEKLPGVFVGLSSSNIQIRGLITSYELIEKGESKKVKSRAKTIAKKWFKRDTYQEPNQPGSFITISLRDGGFSHLSVGKKQIGSGEFASPVEPVRETRTVKKFSGLPSMADCMFVIDTTGSNASSQPAIRSALNDMIDLLSNIDVHVGFVFQGDYCDGEAKLAKTYPPQSLSEARNILNKSHDTGGGDAPEAYEVGLHRARTVAFRPGAKKLIVMVTDAVPHKHARQYGQDSRSMRFVKHDFDKEFKFAIKDDVSVHFLATTMTTQSVGARWSKSMASKFDASQYMNIQDRKELPYVLAGVISAEMGQLEEYAEKAKSKGVYSVAVEGALRVFQSGKRGFSERVAVSSDTGASHDLVTKYCRRAASSVSVAEARKLKKTKDGTAFVELTKATTLKAPVCVASLVRKGNNKGKKAWVRNLGSGESDGKLRIGPDAHSRIFVKVSNEKQKKIRTGETVLFLNM